MIKTTSLNRMIFAHAFDAFHASEEPVNTAERTHQYRCAGDL